MGLITIVFPIEPYPKGRPRMTRRGTCYTPRKTRDFELALKLIASRAYKEPPLLGALSLEVYCFLERPPSVKRKLPAVKPDGDNFVKSICDAMNGILWRDDAQIVDLVFQKRYAIGNGSIKLTVKHNEKE